VNPRLTPAQIDDIVAAAEHVDVPADQLLAAAAEIRAALLGTTDDVVLDLTQAPAVDIALPQLMGLRRARVVRTALVAAALSLAVLLSAAFAGALPASLQHPIADVAKLIGINVPQSDSAPTVDSSAGIKVASNSPTPGGTRAGAAGAPDPTGTTETAVATEDTTEADAAMHGPINAQGNAYAYGFGKEPGVPADPNPPGQLDNPGNAYGREPGVPGNGNAYGIGNGNGNGPPEDPGNGNGNGIGNGPPDNPGNVS